MKRYVEEDLGLEFRFDAMISPRLDGSQDPLALRLPPEEVVALDVQDPEPLPADHLLWQAKNIIITPHISASSDRQMQRYWLVVRENLRRYVNGERMLNVVNLGRGY